MSAAFLVARKTSGMSPAAAYEDCGCAGPFSWNKRKDGSWDVYCRIPNMIDCGDDIYSSLGGIAADDGFGNLVLIGGLQ